MHFLSGSIVECFKDGCPADKYFIMNTTTNKKRCYDLCPRTHFVSGTDKECKTTCGALYYRESGGQWLCSDMEGCKDNLKPSAERPMFIIYDKDDTSIK